MAGNSPRLWPLALPCRLFLVHECVSQCLTYSCAFLCIFLLFVLSYSGLFLFYYLAACLYSNEKDKERVQWGRSRRSWGRGNCNQNLLYEKNIFFNLKKEKNYLSMQFQNQPYKRHSYSPPHPIGRVLLTFKQTKGIYRCRSSHIRVDFHAGECKPKWISGLVLRSCVPYLYLFALFCFVWGSFWFWFVFRQGLSK